MSNNYYETGANHYDQHRELHIGIVNGGDVGKLIKTFFKDEVEEAEVVEKEDILSVLCSEAALKYWQGLREANFVDEGNQLLPTTTRQQAMYIAEIFSEKLGVKSKWKLFEEFWHINNLAQEKNHMKETGRMPKRYDDIDFIFRD